MNHKNMQSYNLVIFGAKGDLSCRKLIPALYQLEKKKLLHYDTRIIGVGRANWKKNDYIKQTIQSLNMFSTEKIQEKYWNTFKDRLYFCNLDVSNTNNFENLKNLLSQKLNKNIYYFAMPPHTFGNICKGLGSVQLNDLNNRIIVEKPIGTSLQSSQNIHNQLSTYFQEKQIFRIDHYLGKETILNLLNFRFSNPLFYNNWNCHTIEYIEIIIAEKVGIEGRWEYFDKVGQTKDMIQNHLLQILSLIAMSPPKKINVQSIKNEKIKVLQALRAIDANNIHENTIIGQYSSGMIDGKLVPGYIEENPLKQKSNTETFSEIKAYIDNDVWKNVPFYLRTGKRLFKKYSEIIIHFKCIPNNIFNCSISHQYHNKLKIRLQPHEGIEISFLNKIPDLNSKYILQEQKLDFSYRKSFKNIDIVDAYERLLLESMKNDPSLFVSKEEIEASWKWIDSIINAWKKNNIQPILYPAGTLGPKLSRNNN
ncbi:glucose-6-phosphate dehydrogenase [Buchnera aphidicola]|uniref:glucose-6-phosphate dehydrogenase n=1 Tax=Buchnera aphidicola TaxID=9 RepID=UPI0034640EDF